MRSVLAVFVAAIAIPVGGASQDWKRNLREELKALYPQTKQATFEQNQVTAAGVQLVVRKENIQAEPVGNFGSYASRVQNGEVLAPGGAGGFFSRSNTRMLKPGEKLFVTDIDVRNQDVQFVLLTTEMYDVVERGTTRPTRMRSVIRFEIPKDKLPTMSALEIKAIVDAVIAPEAEVAAASTKTIALGQTMAEVEKILGKPETVINLGRRVTYVYKNMKIIFTDGKVSDVQ